MPSETVVSNTSPLLSLALIDRLDLVRASFSAVYVPDVVWQELTAGEAGTESIRRLRDDGNIEISRVPSSPFHAELKQSLDTGEAAAIALAIEKDADLILLDEREARAVARRHGLDLTGAIGLILQAASSHEELERDLSRLRTSGFWIDDTLYAEILEQFDENT